MAPPFVSFITIIEFRLLQTDERFDGSVINYDSLASEMLFVMLLDVFSLIQWIGCEGFANG